MIMELSRTSLVMLVSLLYPFDGIVYLGICRLVVNDAESRSLNSLNPESTITQ